jgi:hypothetical protein
VVEKVTRIQRTILDTEGAAGFANDVCHPVEAVEVDDVVIEPELERLPPSKTVSSCTSRFGSTSNTREEWRPLSIARGVVAWQGRYRRRGERT